MSALQRDQQHYLTAGSNVSPRSARGQLVSLDARRPLDSALRQSVITIIEKRKRVPLSLLRMTPELHSVITDQGSSRSFALTKRVMDLCISIPLALLTLFLFPFIAIAIRVSSPGPVFYGQTRLGQHGVTFRVWKFRTMRNDAEALGAAFATVGDPRVTTVGRFLRATRLDELPQVWNILNGDMSFIGPRPERPEHMATISESIPEFHLRTMIKPGLTGWAQVSYPYASTIEELETKLEYDLYYIKSASVVLDIRILFRTAKTVVSCAGR